MGFIVKHVLFGHGQVPQGYAAMVVSGSVSFGRVQYSMFISGRKQVFAYSTGLKDFYDLKLAQQSVKIIPKLLLEEKLHKFENKYCNHHSNYQPLIFLFKRVDQDF